MKVKIYSLLDVGQLNTRLWTRDNLVFSLLLMLFLYWFLKLLRTVLALGALHVHVHVLNDGLMDSCLNSYGFLYSVFAHNFYSRPSPVLWTAPSFSLMIQDFGQGSLSCEASSNNVGRWALVDHKTRVTLLYPSQVGDHIASTALLKKFEDPYTSSRLLWNSRFISARCWTAQHKDMDRWW